MSSHLRNISQSASVIALATVVSRILGFLRDVVIAFSLGAGPMADAFFVAFRVPNLLRRLFAEGSMTMAFIPVFTRVRQESGLEQAFVLARSVMIWLLAILGVLTILAMLGAKPLTFAVAAGFNFKDDPAVLELTVLLLRICFPYILFISGVALCMGILNSLGHFFAPALAPCVLNIVLILVALSAYWLGVRIPVALAVGVLVAGLGQWLLQQPFLKARGFSWRGPISLRQRGVRRMGRLMLPTVFGAAVYQLNILVNTNLASFLPHGSISYLYYADRLVQFPLGVFGAAISTAALPSLSALASRKEAQGFSQAVEDTIGLNLFISLPAAAGLIALREPIISTLFGHGAFSNASVQATALALIGYAVGLPAFCCVRALVSAFYALEDTKTPVRVASVCLVINAGLGLSLMGPLNHFGLALAVSLASWANTLGLGFWLGRSHRKWFLWKKSHSLMLLMSLLIGLCGHFGAGLGRASLLLIPVLAGGYVLAGRAFRIKEADMLIMSLQPLGRKLGLGSERGKRTGP